MDFFLGATYDLGSLGKWRLAEITRHSDGTSTFRLLQADRTLIVGQSWLLDRVKTHKTISIKIEFKNAQAVIDKLAEAQARLLLREGWYCISGKHLTIARRVGPATGGYVGVGIAENLRRDPTAERKTVDVDTYVALKKLRRQQQRLHAEIAKRTFKSGFVSDADVQQVPFPRACKTEWVTPGFTGFPLRRTVAERFVADYEARSKGRTYAEKAKIVERLLRKANADTLEARVERAAADYQANYDRPPAREHIRDTLKAGELK